MGVCVNVYIISDQLGSFLEQLIWFIKKFEEFGNQWYAHEAHISKFFDCSIDADTQREQALTRSCEVRDDRWILRHIPGVWAE